MEVLYLFMLLKIKQFWTVITNLNSSKLLLQYYTTKYIDFESWTAEIDAEVLAWEVFKLL